ncbi:HK97-gp10 family putative phage morphogenesis protein [Neorhizobium petrolearium]|uniref:HK97-gp10 family putative phage morphogenesis protein n=1 Tax=Neorhizobium petrolearium TaxID=515361 RepID=UPI001F418144|nr:HK97-gp10 family putative phage morphogenesis protein [Neorhizobium petrolearium]
MRLKVRVEGLKELDKALGALPRATGKNVSRRALMKAGQVIADAGRDNAPEKEGHLKASYGVGTKLTRRQRQQHRKESPVEVFAGPNDPAAVQTEFGNEHQAAEPHLRPAWDANKDKALEIVKDELTAEIAKAVSRAERKAARAAARLARGR